MRTEPLELRRCVVLSTGHLTQATALAADMSSTPDNDEHLFRTEYGYFAYLSQTHEPAMPDDYWECCQYVHERLKQLPDYNEDEAIYLMFDRDGPRMDGLPHYDW